MNFATWKLDFSNPNYGTGPEKQLNALGFSAEASWSNGEVSEGGTILGYVSGVPDESLLSTWEYQNISEEEALEFAKAINPNAVIVDGRVETLEPEA